MAKINIKKKVDFRYNFGIYWGFLKRYKFLVLVTLFTILLASFKQVLDKYLFKIIVDQGTNFSSGALAVSEFMHILLIISIVFAGASLINAFVGWLEIHSINRLESGIIIDLKRKFFNHVLSLDHSFHVTHKTGSMISRIIRGGGSVERMTDVLFFNFANVAFQFILATISLIYLDWSSAVSIFGVMVVFVSYSVFLQRKQQGSRLEYVGREDSEKANISDIFTNIDSIKFFGKEALIKKRYEKLSSETKRAQISAWDFFKWMNGGQSFILAAGTFLVLFFPVMNLLHGSITLGTLTFVYTIYLSLIGSMFNLVQGVRGFYRAMADFQDLFEYGKIDKEIKDKPNAEKLTVKQGEVVFRDINFHYNKKRSFGLENFSLRIKPNEKVALVGHSGCGKTTLIKLLYRLYDVKSGEILVDGKNIKDVKQESLREELSIVPQECILFDDTIFNNIKFSNPKASRQEVMDAIKFAQLDKLIETFPRKERTIVGERGVKLSGGEKQRVSIARAILANKRVLVLDEATSALDSETEHEIQRNLYELLEGRTSIIIAHRLSTIMNSDRIIVMKHGKIIQEGNHRQLINRPGEYQKLWNLQKGGYIK